jgi:hypothetical protein
MLFDLMKQYSHLMRQTDNQSLHTLDKKNVLCFIINQLRNARRLLEFPVLRFCVPIILAFL